MSSTPDELVSDPVFQVNAVLWLTQPLGDRSQIVPLLHDNGFAVHAIAPLLALPPDVRLRVEEAGVSAQEGFRPDVVLVHEGDRKFAFTECKASSFGPASTTAAKPRSLLLVAGRRSAEVLGLPASRVSAALLAFVTAENQRDGFGQTLGELRRELHGAALDSGESAVLGLTATQTSIGIVADEAGSKFFGLAEGTSDFMQREAETDPRPLYIIPYDPDVEQSDEERALSKRILFERVWGTVVSALGHAYPPAEFRLESEKMLNDAMFGMYGLWDSRDSRRHMRRLCRQLMGAVTDAVNSVVPKAMTYVPGEGWKVSLQDQQQQEHVLDALRRFSCETMDLRSEPRPGLFDDLDDEPAGT